jgi:hypothetical protein
MGGPPAGTGLASKGTLKAIIRSYEGLNPDFSLAAEAGEHAFGYLTSRGRGGRVRTPYYGRDGQMIGAIQQVPCRGSRDQQAVTAVVA